MPQPNVLKERFRPLFPRAPHAFAAATFRSLKTFCLCHNVPATFPMQKGTSWATLPPGKTNLRSASKLIPLGSKHSVSRGGRETKTCCGDALPTKKHNTSLLLEAAEMKRNRHIIDANVCFPRNNYPYYFASCFAVGTFAALRIIGNLRQSRNIWKSVAPSKGGEELTFGK
ncbi:hypothetical protein AVEN_121605-1 [Araneus ventricosus]|uniref:Uncharacterized protein n=1 Tax=Araneus ventricosus TaxID=182803 RepID=A0A4Y2LVG7_ARAVE|nr:hypothetical protein AVEN_121605-1 [Araneus ventricosus]